MLFQLKQYLKEASGNKYFLLTQWLVAGILVLLTVWILTMWQKLPPVIPLFYSLPWGEGQLAPPIALAGLMLLCFILGTINTILAIFIKKIDQFFYYVILTTSIVLSFLTALTLIKITLLVT